MDCPAVDAAPRPVHVLLGLRFGADVTVSIGVDVGREHDLTVIAVVEQVEGGDVWLRAVRSFANTAFQAQEDAILEYHRRYRPARIVVDATGIGAELAENAHRKIGRVEEMKVTDAVKAEIMGRAWDLFMEGKVKVPLKYRAVVDEVGYIRREQTPAGNVVFRDDPHGDAGWAFLYALRGLPKARAGVVDVGGAFRR